MEHGDQAEHAEHEHQTGEVERPHQLAKRHERAQAILADGECHGAKGSDRCKAHDHADHVEENV